MGKIKLFSLAILLLFFYSCSSMPKLAEYSFEQRPLAAVMPFVYSAKDNPEFADSVSGMTDSFMTSMMQIGRIRLIERQRLEYVLKEMNLNMSGIVDSSSAVRAGKQIGAKIIILGSISNASVKDEFRSIAIAEKTDRYVEVKADARMVDVETGELLASASASNEIKSSEKHAFGAKAGALADKKELFKKALMGLSDKLAYELSKNIRPLK